MTSNAVSGDLRVFSIFDVSQSLMMGRKTACVIMERDGLRGYLYFKDGTIIAALDDQLGTGDHAAMGLFAWRTGTFAIDFSKQAPEKNIDTPTDYLMLEVARNLDEVQRDQADVPDEVAPSDQAVGDQVRGRLDNALATKLNQAFSRVATAAEPSRSLYSPDIFDKLLTAFVARSGTALFLQVGQRPRIRTVNGFDVLQEDAIESSEIRGFLKGALTPSEWNELEVKGEVSTYHKTARSGSFRLHVTQEWGSHLLTFLVATRSAPQLLDVCGDLELVEGLRNVKDGLVLVAGPVGGGKSRLVASLIQAHVENKDRLAVVFASSPQHTFTTEHSLCMHRQLPPPGIAFHTALRSSMEQGADLIAILGAMDRESFHNALGAAGANRLVIFTMESHSAPQTLNRLIRWAHTDDGDPLLDALSRSLRYVVDVRSGEGTGPLNVTHLRVDRVVEDALRTGDLDYLRRQVLAGGAGITSPLEVHRNHTAPEAPRIPSPR